MPLDIHTLVRQRAHEFAGSIIASVGTGAADYVFSFAGPATTQAAAITPNLVHVDPSTWYPAPTRMKLLASCATNATAPGTTLVVGLYPVGTPVGGVGVLNPALGTVVPGSTVTFTTPALSTKSALVDSGDFALPAAGMYCLGVNLAGAMAANSAAGFYVRIEVMNAVTAG